MRITLNELRNLVKNILKENIQFPNKGENLNTDALETQIINYVKDNIKIYSVSKDEYVTPKVVKIDLTTNPKKYSSLLFITERDGENGAPIYLIDDNGELKLQVSLGSGKIKFFETKQNLIFIANLIYDITKFIENYYDFPSNISKESIVNKLTKELGFNKDTTDYIKGATDATSSSEFRRGGGKNQGKLGGDYKSKFGNEPAEEPVVSSGGKTYANYNEWIGNESAENQKAIAVLYRMVEKGRMEEDEFNSEIQELLNTPLNEIRKLIKKLIKEEKGKKEISKEEKEKWASNYFKYYDDWMLELSKAEREEVRKLYNQRQYGTISKAEFQSKIAKKSKEWGI